MKSCGLCECPSVFDWGAPNSSFHVPIIVNWQSVAWSLWQYFGWSLSVAWNLP
uniref:Uncharacterized protein n=1 Tax=Rhizophora mucronata TaxID=61149 RepID=A0A2P2NL44_RHIMU